jgi:hypothetical protein
VAKLKRENQALKELIGEITIELHLAKIKATAAAVPEPTPLFLTLTALLALALVGRKRNVLGLSRANRTKS